MVSITSRLRKDAGNIYYYYYFTLYQSHGNPQAKSSGYHTVYTAAKMDEHLQAPAYSYIFGGIDTLVAKAVCIVQLLARLLTR